MFKKIFIYSLFFTFYLESIEGRKFTHTEIIRDINGVPIGMTMVEFFENNGKLMGGNERQYKATEWTDQPKEEAFEHFKRVLKQWSKFNYGEIMYKYMESTHRVEKREMEMHDALIATYTFYYPNGNIWVKKEIENTIKTILYECYDEDGIQIDLDKNYRDWLVEGKGIDCDAKDLEALANEGRVE